MDRLDLVVVGAGAQAAHLGRRVVGAEHDDRHVAPDPAARGPGPAATTRRGRRHWQSMTARWGGSFVHCASAWSPVETMRTWRSVALEGSAQEALETEVIADDKDQGSHRRDAIRRCLRTGPPMVPAGPSRKGYGWVW